jgi:hypothetical protein
MDGVKYLLDVITKVADAIDGKPCRHDFPGCTEGILMDDGNGGGLIRQNICLPFLHACVDRSIPNQAAQAKGVSAAESEARVIIAHMLLHSPAFSLHIDLQNIEGLSVLHLAARYGDYGVMAAVLETDYSKLPSASFSQAKRQKYELPFDINAHCAQRGWTPLHYAASGCHTEMCWMLMDFGADPKLLSVIIADSSSVGSAEQVTSLDLVNAKLNSKTPLHPATSQRLWQLQMEMATSPVTAVTNKVIPATAGSKANVTPERINTNHNDKNIVTGAPTNSSANESKSKPTPKTKAEKPLTEKELKEKELLEKKQKQLKEKQDKLEREQREREQKQSKAEAESKKKTSQSSNTKTKVSGVASSVTPSTVASSAPASISPPIAGNSNGAASLPAAGDAPSVNNNDAAAESTEIQSETAVKASAENAEPAPTASAKKAKKKKEKSADDASTKTVVHNPTTVIPNVGHAQPASRDELLEHLLAMGFPESDCLTALTVCGKDLDAAITWLCENPPGTQPPPAKVISASAPTHPTEKTGGKAEHTPSKVTAPPTKAPAPVQPPAVVQTTAEANAKLQKEKDLKEEMRRINRAWNAKAEDEKKKIELERVQKEAEKQRELVAQQQLQKQVMLQQQQLQQQPPHLQQPPLQHSLSQSPQQMSQPQMYPQGGFYPPSGPPMHPHHASFPHGYNRSMYHQNAPPSSSFQVTPFLVCLRSYLKLSVAKHVFQFQRYAPNGTYAASSPPN